MHVTVAQDPGHLGGVGGSGSVEAVPAEPEDEAAQGTHGQGVAGDSVDLDRAVFLFGVLADAGAKQNGPDEGGDAAHHVDHRGAGKVHKAQLGQPALAVPHPARLNGIDHRADDGGVDAVGQEFGPLRHSPRDNGGGSGAEYQLEEEVGPVEAVEVGEQLVLRPSDQAEEVVLTIHDPVAQEHKDHGADAEVHQVLHDDVARVFGPGEASLHHGEAALHEKYKYSSY